MSERIVAVKAGKYPLVHVTFDDGLAGDIDFSGDIKKFPMFRPLKDRKLFTQVGFDFGGSRFGWRLNEVGNEIDYGSDQIRARVETAFIINLARSDSTHPKAAE